VLLPHASAIGAADERLAARLTGEILASVAAEIPPDWLDDGDVQVYAEYLSARMRTPRAFVEEADAVRL
jgi:hypothetical protein